MIHNIQLLPVHIRDTSWTSLSIVAGYESEMNSWTRNYLSARFYFLFFFLANIFLQPQTLHDGGCLHSLFIYIFWINFWCTNLSVIKVGNTVTVRAGNTGYVLSTYTTAYMEARPVSPCCKADSLSAHTQPYYWWYSFTSKNLTWWGAILWWPCYSSSCFLDLLHCLQNVSVYDHRPILFSVDIGKFVQNRVLCL